MPSFLKKEPTTEVDADGITTITCMVCGHRTSGPNAASVKATHKRHEETTTAHKGK